MASNPDYGNYGASGGDLRFVQRHDRSDPGHPSVKRILQRWEYSYTDGKWDWYDVTTVNEE